MAFKLGMPVYRLMQEMPYEELLNWFAYFGTRPPGWQDDQRAAMLLQAQGVKEKPEKLFPSLRIIKYGVQANEEQITAKSLVSSGLFQKLKTAAEHNKVNWEVSVEDQNESQSV